MKRLIPLIEDIVKDNEISTIIKIIKKIPTFLHFLESYA